MEATRRIVEAAGEATLIGRVAGQVSSSLFLGFRLTDAAGTRATCARSCICRCCPSPGVDARRPLSAGRRG